MYTSNLLTGFTIDRTQVKAVDPTEASEVLADVLRSAAPVSPYPKRNLRIGLPLSRHMSEQIIISTFFFCVLQQDRYWTYFPPPLLSRLPPPVQFPCVRLNARLLPSSSLCYRFPRLELPIGRVFPFGSLPRVDMSIL